MAIGNRGRAEQAMAAAEALALAFRHPPSNCGPIPAWWWIGEPLMEPTRRTVSRSSPSSARANSSLVLGHRPLYLQLKEDLLLRIVLATVDLSQRYSPHWKGGPLRSAPGGRRVRQTLIQPIEEEIAREARRWWEA